MLGTLITIRTAFETLEVVLFRYSLRTSGNAVRTDKLRTKGESSGGVEPKLEGQLGFIFFDMSPCRCCPSCRGSFE